MNLTIADHEPPVRLIVRRPLRGLKSEISRTTGAYRFNDVVRSHRPDDLDAPRVHFVEQLLHDFDRPNTARPTAL